MPLYIGDYLADTQHLTPLQHGVYFLLIMAYWRNGGPLPDENNSLRMITKMSRSEWKKMRPTMEHFFEISDGQEWRHKRIDAELEKAETLANARRSGGNMTAAKRWA